ncbi:MAG: hypothetical protein RSD88_02225 [Anaerovoracaceae bacterium]
MKKLTIMGILLIFTLALMGCGGDTGNKTANKMGTQPGDDTKVILTIKGSQKEKTFTEADLVALGTQTRQYSGRNKEKNNTRQVRKYTGVDVKTLLKSVGYGEKDEIINVVCSDGFAKDYAVEDLEKLLSFKDEKEAEGEVVAPMLAIIQEGDYMGNDKEYKKADGSPLRLVYGQEDYDSEYTKDFNMQGWASYVKEIKVTNE